MESGREADFTLINMTQLFNHHGDDCYKWGMKDGAMEASNRCTKEGMSEPWFGGQRGRRLTREGAGEVGRGKHSKPPCQAFSLTCPAACLHAQSLSRVQLFATPWTVAHQVPLSMRFFQAGILEWVAMPSSRGSCQPSVQTQGLKSNLLH